ncbi:MAG: hypothetical protein QM775_14305 [Pirellulales bacterium]
MFVRFVVGEEGEDHRQLTGVVTEARLLREKGVLEPYQEDWLAETYAWLNDNLPCPPFSTSDWPRDVVAWFKDDAGESISKMWGLVSLLREHNSPVRVLRSKNPGKVFYEDEYQIVVEEWRAL